MTTTEQLVGLYGQSNEIFRRVGNGSLDPVAVKRAFQDIIEGVVKVPSIVGRVERQLAQWASFGVVIEEDLREQILRQADAFVPFSASDEPLVSGGFGYNNPTALSKRLLGHFVPPSNYSFIRYYEDSSLRYTAGMKPKNGLGLRLVHYDSNAFPGLSPEDAVKRAKQQKLRLAGIEGIEKLVLEPEEALKWDGKNIFFPNLSGLELQYNGAWSSVPCLGRWGGGRRFRFRAGWAGIADAGWASPVVREC